MVIIPKQTDKIPQTTAGSRVAPCLLCFQKAFVFVGGGAADVADPCQFTDVELSVFMGGIVAEKTCGDVLFAHLRLNTPAICKNASLIEVGLPVPAVNRDAPHNHKAQFLFGITSMISITITIDPSTEKE